VTLQRRSFAAIIAATMLVSTAAVAQGSQQTVAREPSYTASAAGFWARLFTDRRNSQDLATSWI